MPLNRVTIDVPPVTEDEAVELMVHHLALAAAYYEAVPEDGAAVRGEVERLMTDHQLPTWRSPGLQAACAWLDRIYQAHEAIRSRGSDEAG